MIPRQGKPCPSLPDGDLIYAAVKDCMNKIGFVVRHTPLFSEEERINILWLWCMENYNKYDPEKGDLNTWVRSVARRIIDAYRKERGSRRYITMQFPECKDNKGNPVYYDNMIIDPATVSEHCGIHEHEIDTKDDIKFMWKTVEQEIGKIDNRRILMNYAQTISDKDLSKTLGIVKGTMQTRRTQYKRKVRNALQKKNVIDR